MRCSSGTLVPCMQKNKHDAFTIYAVGGSYMKVIIHLYLPRCGTSSSLVETVFWQGNGTSAWGERVQPSEKIQGRRN